MKNKIITICMLLCLIVGILSTNAYVYASDNVLVGDINLDGKITIRDATYIQMYISKFDGYKNLTNKEFIAGDVNSDNLVNILDVTLIQKFRVGIETNTLINQYIEYTEPTTPTTPTTTATEATTDGQWLPGFFD